MVKRFIQVGTGGFGRYWCRRILPAVADVAVPVAAVDVNREALQNAEFAGIPEENRYTDIREALKNHKADFLVLVIPPEYREEYIDLAIEYGLDVLCEKPLGASMEACVRIYNRMKKAGLKLAVTMSHRFEHEKQTVEQLVKSGSYGKLNYLVSRLNIVRGLYANIDTVERYVTSCLVHNLDTMRGVAGANVKTVYAVYWPHVDNGEYIGWSGLTMLEMTNGVRASLEESFANGSTLDGWSDEYLRAECTDGTIIADHKRVTVRSDCGLPYPREAEMPQAKGEHWSHDRILREFVSWLDGGDAPTTCIEDNMQCAALMFAAIESAKSGQKIDVQEYLSRYL